ncbi:MAG: glycine zipper 2TM domain-containing protein [Novosphingobium sp.]|nr:glycine zipper 2TM domain-containing protein [Novosphingobium sp.]
MRTALRTAALGLALPAVMFTAAPAAAHPAFHGASTYAQSDSWQHGRERDYRYNSYSRSSYAEPVYASTPVWRGDDGRYYCRKKNGTTGLIIGGAAGALIGREIAGRGDRMIGTILGAAGGALLGRKIDRDGSQRRCR